MNIMLLVTCRNSNPEPPCGTCFACLMHKTKQLSHFHTVQPQTTCAHFVVFASTHDILSLSSCCVSNLPTQSLVLDFLVLVLVLVLVRCIPMLMRAGVLFCQARPAFIPEGALEKRHGRVPTKGRAQRDEKERRNEERQHLIEKLPKSVPQAMVEGLLLCFPASMASVCCLFGLSHFVRL